MEEKKGAQTLERRELVAVLDREFARLHFRALAFIELTPAARLYENPSQAPFLKSVGENVLRSAAAIEQTFGGVTANLWDDPFEWTLPEQLTTAAAVAAHLAEVEELRKRAFTSFNSDSCLIKSVATPGGELVSLVELLLQTLGRAGHYQSLAAVAIEALSGIRPAGFII